MFGTMEFYSRHGQFEPLRVNLGIMSLIVWGLTTYQPLWIILCCLQEKGRKEIEEIVEMKERDREEIGQECK